MEVKVTVNEFNSFQNFKNVQIGNVWIDFVWLLINQK